MSHTSKDINLTFLSQKGFYTSTLTGLKKALSWLQTTDADMFMRGEGTGDPFDIIVSKMRRPMLISSVEAAMAGMKS